MLLLVESMDISPMELVINRGLILVNMLLMTFMRQRLIGFQHGKEKMRHYKLIGLKFIKHQNNKNNNWRTHNFIIVFADYFIYFILWIFQCRVVYIFSRYFLLMFRVRGLIRSYGEQFRDYILRFLKMDIKQSLRTVR